MEVADQVRPAALRDSPEVQAVAPEQVTLQAPEQQAREIPERPALFIGQAPAAADHPHKEVHRDLYINRDLVHQALSQARQ